VNSNKELGHLDVKLTLVFIKYASIMASGILKPKKIDKQIERVNSFNENFDFLSELEQSDPFRFF
jgi:hypothetical protein